MEPPLQDLSTVKPAPAGRCIYCGSKQDLSDEHILPYGLSGPTAIPRASCPKCARITGAIERDVLRGALWPLRVYRDLKSRTKHRDAPSTIQVTLVYDDGREENVQLPIEDAPIFFIFPIFAPPATVDPQGYTSGIRVRGTASIGTGDRHKQVLTQYGATSLRITQTTMPVTFARMIAKIAYAMAFADGSLARLGTRFPVVPAILGQTDDIGRWVGSYTDEPPRHPKLLHHLVGREFPDRGLFVYEVQLFADSQAPCYTVVLGRPHGRRDEGAASASD